MVNNEYIQSLDEQTRNKVFQIPFPSMLLEYFNSKGIKNPIKELGHNLVLIGNSLFEAAVRIVYDPNASVDDEKSKGLYQSLYILLFRDMKNLEEDEIEEFISVIDNSIYNIMNSIAEINNHALSNDLQYNNKFIDMCGLTILTR